MKMPWISRREAARLRDEAEAARAAAAQCRAFEEAALKELMELRAMLMQLRVYQTQEQGRSGFAVTAFIPQETVDRIRRDGDKQHNFIVKVARHLVRRAVMGLVHVTQPGNRVTSITFEKIGATPVVGVWKENQKRPIILGGTSETTRKQIEQ
jgi:hypothetical protein